MSQNNTKEKSIFEKLTHKYSLSKTLRFELRPVGNTAQMLIESGVVQLDEQRKQNFEKTKPYLDRLHQEFITESLSEVHIETLKGYDVVYKAWKADRKSKDLQKILENKEKSVREEIVGLFDKKAEVWVKNFLGDVKLKKTNHEFLFESTIFSLLQKKYDDETEVIIDGKSIFESWDKWSAYFKKFFETRKNFYKSDGTATAVATRIVNDNLRRFCDNSIFYEHVREAKIDLSNLEKDFGITLKNVFSLPYYNTCLNQNGISAYNAVLGGEVREGGKKIKGINEYINEHYQKTGEKVQRLKKLDKQIGSDKENFIDAIESDEELTSLLRTFVDDAKAKVGLFDTSVEYLISQNSVDFSGVYFKKEAINTITRRWFANQKRISDALIRSFNDKKIVFDEKSEEYKFPNFISWQIIKNAIELLNLETEEERESLWKDWYYEENPQLNSLNVWQQFLIIFQSEYGALKLNGHEKSGKSFTQLTAEIELLLIEKTFERNETSTEIVKLFSDRVLNVYRFAKYFALDKSRQWNTETLDVDDFYTDYEVFYRDSYEKIVKVYDKIRNYMTKDQVNKDKWKLNFENPTLANGWDKNKETDNTAVILRKDGRFYLAIMDKEHNTLFKKTPNSLSGYEKMTYKLFPDPAKMMPKVCFSQKGLEFFRPSEEIVRIYKNNEFKKGDTFSLQSMQKLIAFYKTALKSYSGWTMYNFTHVKETNTYTGNIGDFYRDVAEDGYQISFEHISEQYIRDANSDGKLYLFEIHNKDWNLKDSVKKTGTKNTHTLYFEQIFSDENAKNNFVVKLNGEAELFFRPATEKAKLGTKLVHGKEVVMHKRYAQDKMFLHVPITLNRTAPDARKFNQFVNTVIANNPDIHIIGIDRGEKHLAYLSVINQKGEILESSSLNIINGIPYAQLLEERANNRERARRDWKSVEQIKNLKKGYIANVVREVADLIIKYNAIVVFEDLNMRFKQVRGGIEKSVYQQLEKALIDKLNFLVNKNEMDSHKAGHILHAYQLTAPLETFKEMGKQTGVLFYTQAEYTSQTDPVSGFRKNVYISNSETVGKIKEYLEKFNAIGWDDIRESYYFRYNPSNFVGSKLKDNVASKEWTVYADVPRIKRERKNGYWETVSVNPNDELKNLFTEWGFDTLHAEDMKEQIFQLYEEKRLEGRKMFDGRERNFWQSFIFLFNLILQVRNSTATQYKRNEHGEVVERIDGVDFIASPVAPFFTTDGGKYTEGRVNLARLADRFVGENYAKAQFKKEFNGDANGAYNIARKGIMILQKIVKNPEKPDLYISKKDWDVFVSAD